MIFKTVEDLFPVKVLSLIKILMVTLLVATLGLSLSTATASTQNWPLHAKGEVRYLKMIKVKYLLNFFKILN